MTTAASRSRLLDLMKIQCKIFSTTFNPTGIRTGNKILRQRLKGPTVASYYPRRVATTKDLMRAFKGMDVETWDDDEEERLEQLQITKARGKGAPRKKRTAEESKKFKGKKSS